MPLWRSVHVLFRAIPYSAAACGSKLVFAGPHMDGKSVFHLMEDEKVTFTAGVPTVWCVEHACALWLWSHG